MTQVQFYQLLTTPLERALPKLLEKIVAGGFRTLLVAESDERVEQLNQLLWTYDPDSFLPHGSLKDDNSSRQPVLLISPSSFGATEGSLPIRNLLFSTNGLAAPQPEQFERIVDMFDGNDSQALAAARTRWSHYKAGGHAISYLKQTESGGWEQKAVA